MPPASQRFSITVCTRASLDAPGCQAGQQKDEKMAASSMCLFLPAVVLWLNVYTMENVLYHLVWLIFVHSLNPSLQFGVCVFRGGGGSCGQKHWSLTLDLPVCNPVLLWLEGPREGPRGPVPSHPIPLFLCLVHSKFCFVLCCFSIPSFCHIVKFALVIVLCFL